MGNEFDIKALVKGVLRKAVDSGSISVADIADKLGISRQAVYQYLDPDGPAPSLGRLAELSEILGYSMVDILSAEKKTKRLPNHVVEALHTLADYAGYELVPKTKR